MNGTCRAVGMRQDTAERLQADVAVADVGVPVDARAERRLRIVGVNQRGHSRGPSTSAALRMVPRRPERRGDIEAGGQQMASVQTIADGHAVEGSARSRMARSSSNRLPRLAPQPAVFSSSTVTPPAEIRRPPPSILGHNAEIPSSNACPL